MQRLFSGITSVIAVFVFFLLPVNAQTDTITVPDVTNLSAPQAVALLNANGLTVGQQIDAVWDETARVAANLVSEQSIAPGEEVSIGTAVDITVLRIPNALLIYDDNDITLVNQSGQDIRLAGIRFTSLGTEPRASFAATEWNADMLRANRCAQLWSVGRNGPKGLDECQFIQMWRSITDTTRHFWTGANGATRFRVAQSGQARAVCEIAAGRCQFYLAVPSESDVTEHVYFAYTTDRLVVFNNTEDQWMPLEGLQVLNRTAAPEGILNPLSDAALFGSEPLVGSLTQLAPMQCLLYVTDPSIEVTPLPCTVIATAEINPANAFWLARFGVGSVTDDREHNCPAATPEKLTVCLMPR